MKREYYPSIVIEVPAKLLIVTHVMHQTPMFGKVKLAIKDLELLKTSKGLNYEYGGMWYPIDENTEFVYA